MSDFQVIEGERSTRRDPRIKLTPFDEIRLGTRPRYLVSTFIPLTGLAVIWGPPKCGKSFWAFDALMHVALGWEYRGLKVQRGPVVYCAFEGQSGIEARAEAFRQRFLPQETDWIPFFLVTVPLDLVADHAELVEAIKSQISSQQPVAVALDTLNRSLRGSESSDEDMAAYVKAADAIKDAFECAVLVVHHCGHERGRPRGHSSLTAAADVQIKVTRDAADNIIAEVELAKDGPAGHSVTSRLEVVEVGVDEEGEAITSCVVLPAEGAPPGPAKKGRALPKTAKTALRLLAQAIDEAGIEAPASNHIPAKARVVGIETWRRYAYQGGISTGEERAKQKAFKGAFELLVANGHAHVWGDLAWID